MESLTQARRAADKRVLSVPEQVALAKIVVRAFFKTSRLSASDIDDCLGDVLEDLARRPLCNVDERGTAPLLIQRVKWSLYDSLRRRRRRAMHRELAASFGEELAGAFSETEISDDDVQRVLRAIESLEPIDVDLVVSTTAYDERLQTVASRCGLSVSAAWRRRERAFEKVRARCALGAQRSSGRSGGGSGRRR